MSESRIVLVSTPVPADAHAFESDRTAQLIASIRTLLDARWTGWSPMPAKSPQRTPPTDKWRGAGTSGLVLSQAEVTAIRGQVSTHMLWPVFHGRPDLMKFDAQAYETFLEANRRLASTLRPQLREGDVVWVHDFLHAPLAAALRDEGFLGPVGFLLYPSFPSAVQLATLPVHKQFLQELCCYDLLGFQTESCRARFQEAVTRFLGSSARDDINRDNVSGPFGSVKTCVCEIPVDTRSAANHAASAAVQRSESFLRKCSNGSRLVGSFTPLNQAQGILERLKSFEALLEHASSLRGRVSMIQAILPSGPWFEEDNDLRVEIEHEFMRINGRYASLEWTPIRYFHRSLAASRLTALYRSVRVGMFTPLNEGVNLRAKDFVAAQGSIDPGVLLASRLAGGPNKLTGALYVNPYDVASVAATLERALEMPLEERRARWLSMMDTLEARELKVWCNEFIDRLGHPASDRPSVMYA